MEVYFCELTMLNIGMKLQSFVINCQYVFTK